MMPPKPSKVPPLTPLDIALERLELCAYVVQELHMELEEPSDAEHKADLLLASENLAYEVIDLLNTAKLYAWGPDKEDEEEYRD
jgi:hypothetical protein